MAKTKKRYNKKRKTKSKTLRKMRGGDSESIFRKIAKLNQAIREEEKKK